MGVPQSDKVIDFCTDDREVYHTNNNAILSDSESVNKPDDPKLSK